MEVALEATKLALLMESGNEIIEEPALKTLDCGNQSQSRFQLQNALDHTSRGEYYHASKLPHEMLSYIFQIINDDERSYDENNISNTNSDNNKSVSRKTLLECSLVCKAWSKLSLDTLWHSPTAHYLSDTELMKLCISVSLPYFSCRNIIKCLDFQPVNTTPNILHVAFRIVMKSCFLKSLHITYDWRPHQLLQILAECPHLTKLGIASHSFPIDSNPSQTSLVNDPRWSHFSRIQNIELDHLCPLDLYWRENMCIMGKYLGTAKLLSYVFFNGWFQPLDYFTDSFTESLKIVIDNIELICMDGDVILSIVNSVQFKHIIVSPEGMDDQSFFLLGQYFSSQKSLETITLDQCNPGPIFEGYLASSNKYSRITSLHINDPLSSLSTLTDLPPQLTQLCKRGLTELGIDITIRDDDDGKSLSSFFMTVSKLDIKLDKLSIIGLLIDNKHALSEDLLKSFLKSCTKISLFKLCGSFINADVDVKKLETEFPHFYVIV